MSLLRILARHAGLELQTPGREAILSRRGLLLGGLSSLAAMSSRKVQAAPRPANHRFLVDRLTMGWTEEEQLLADSLGYHGYLEHHLNPSAINDSACDARIAVYNRLSWSSKGLHDSLPQITNHQTIESTVVRSVYSKRQLMERMVEFWTDHFNIEMGKSHCQWIFPVWLRESIRPHAMGTFPALLAATAQSATMMFYLDNESSLAGNPNENYARELLELHSMGVGGGYSQMDVEEVARCLTGWAVDWGHPQTETWEFKFFANRHDNDAKTVLGMHIPAGGGINDGLTVLNLISYHPSTAQFISRKMCQRFWSYDPPQSLIDAVAATYMSTGGDIKSMLRTLFTTEDPANAEPKFKRPFHLVVSALRATKAEITGQPNATGSILRAELRATGHEPFQWGPPDGYPDRVNAWGELLLPRWSFAAKLTNGDIPDVAINLPAFLQGATTGPEVFARFNQALFGGAMPPAEAGIIQDYLGASPNEQTIRDALGLALAAPSYQWY